MYASPPACYCLAVDAKSIKHEGEQLCEPESRKEDVLFWLPREANGAELSGRVMSFQGCIIYSIIFSRAVSFIIIIPREYCIKLRCVLPSYGTTPFPPPNHPAL